MGNQVELIPFHGESVQSLLKGYRMKKVLLVLLLVVAVLAAAGVVTVDNMPWL